MERKTTANKAFAIAGVPCFADTFVQGGSSVLRMKFSADNPRYRKPPKRYTQPVSLRLNILLTWKDTAPKVGKAVLAIPSVK